MATKNLSELSVSELMKKEKDSKDVLKYSTGVLEYVLNSILGEN
jgi:hypothetical protein